MFRTGENASLGCSNLQSAKSVGVNDEASGWRADGGLGRFTSEETRCSALELTYIFALLGVPFGKDEPGDTEELSIRWLISLSFHLLRSCPTLTQHAKRREQHGLFSTCSVRRALHLLCPCGRIIETDQESC